MDDDEGMQLLGVSSSQKMLRATISFWRRHVAVHPKTLVFRTQPTFTCMLTIRPRYLISNKYLPSTSFSGQILFHIYHCFSPSLIPNTHKKISDGRFLALRPVLGRLEDASSFAHGRILLRVHRRIGQPLLSRQWWFSQCAHGKDDMRHFRPGFAQQGYSEAPGSRCVLLLLPRFGMRQHAIGGGRILQLPDERDYP